MEWRLQVEEVMPGSPVAAGEIPDAASMDGA